MSNPISAGIKRLRAQHKLTQSELATLAKIPRATLANMESDKSNPSIAGVVKVAQALGVTIDDLICTKKSLHVTEVQRNNMSISYQDEGRYISTRVSPITSPFIHINDIQMLSNCHTKGVPHPEGSNEFFLCLQGTATIEVDGETISVEAGNLVCFHGHLPHWYANKGDEAVHALAVITMKN